VGVVGTDYNENKAFISLARHFRSKGISVPLVLAVGEDGMVYIQEDLGHDLLLSMLDRARKKGEDTAEIENMLCRTMSLLPEIQFEGAKGLDFSVCYPQPSFDRIKTSYICSFTASAKRSTVTLNVFMPFSMDSKSKESSKSNF
jgi:aminoglycoside/choline kinase family phosphotransferase